MLKVNTNELYSMLGTYSYSIIECQILFVFFYKLIHIYNQTSLLFYLYLFCYDLT